MDLVEWFYDDIGFIGLTKDLIEKVLLEKIDTLVKIWSYVRELECEAYYKLFVLKSFNEYKESYIDLMILVNAIIIRYVVKNYDKLANIEYHTLMLGELKIKPPKNEHEHGRSKANINLLIEWLRDIIDYLGLSDEEIVEYTDLTTRNIWRITKALYYSIEIPNTQYLIILKGWSTSRQLKNVTNIIGVWIDREETYLTLIEEHMIENQQIIYISKIAKINTEKPI